MKICSLCGGKLKRETRIEKSKYKNTDYEYNQSGRWCIDCGESFLSPEDLESSRKERDIKKNNIDTIFLREN